MRKVLLILLALLLILGITVGVFYLLTPKPKITMRLEGTDALTFAGTITTDGKDQNVSGPLPAEFTVTGRHVKCSFHKTKELGTLTLKLLSEDGNSFTDTYTKQPTGGMKGEITHRGIKILNFINYSKRNSTLTTFELKPERLKTPATNSPAS
ncbi:MAG: hypothetical protein K0Q55_3349, partial [Verrucomicrobia bacterium]|nr:hypothetical protein [Verrucomicrobiota bacterium]